MSQIDTDIMGHYFPQFVVVVYQHQRDYYLESHKILKNGMLGAGKPLSANAVKKIADSFTSKKLALLKQKSTFLKGYVPDKVIYLDQNEHSHNMAWTMKGRSENLYFDKNLKLKDGEAFVPHLLFILRGSLRVFALKDPHVNLMDPVYEAPFPNIAELGSVCLGSTKTNVKISTFQDLMNVYEARFFQSRFTDEGLDRRLAGISMVELWKENMKKAKSFNYDYLIPHGKYRNVKDVLETSFGKEALSR